MAADLFGETPKSSDRVNQREAAKPEGKPLFFEVDRKQIHLRPVDIEDLIAAEDPARAGASVLGTQGVPVAARWRVGELLYVERLPFGAQRRARPSADADPRGPDGEEADRLEPGLAGRIAGASQRGSGFVSAAQAAERVSEGSEEAGRVGERVC